MTMDTIEITDLQDGDVMLYHGNSWLAKAIRFFDGQEVNHAGLYVGGLKVDEALAGGLTERGLQESIKDDEFIIIKRLKSHPGTMTPVLDKAKAYITNGNRYGYEQIVLLAFLALTRKLHVNRYLKWLLRKVLDDAADLLMAQGERQPMICSEFVYRCYDEALPTSTDPYSLEINPLTVKTRISGKKPPQAPLQRDSLLAWAVDVTTPKKGATSELMISFEGLRGKKPSLPEAPEEKRLASMSLDDLIEQYLLEAKKPPQRSALDTEASIRNAEMLESIRKFSEAYYQASLKKGTKAAGQPAVKGEAEDVQSVLTHMLETVADFVTPGDLLNCRSLYNAGKIRL
jgi:hypothetical protein